MPDDLLIVPLCELGERILAMRELLADPCVPAKPHTRAIAALLAHGLDAVEERLQRDVVAPGSRDGTIEAGDLLRALAGCAAAWRLLHRRLGLLDMRWNVAPCDIFLRKLREDAGDLPHPAVVLCDDDRALDDDVAARLRADLHAVGVPTGGHWADAEPVIALPRLEATNPLAWPLLLPALARLCAGQEGSGAVSENEADVATVARLGGPAAFAARAAHALITALPDAPAWPPLAALAGAARACGADLEDGLRADEPTVAAPVAFFTGLLRARDRALGHAEAATAGLRGAERDDVVWPDLPAPALPSAEETAALLEKLVAGTPINAIEPPLPDDFVARLDAVRDATAFYDLIGPLGERPASLAAILGVGWLYKVRHSYALFRDLLGRRETLAHALAAYRPHVVERNELLLQSIEASHVQGIFVRGRMER